MEINKIVDFFWKLSGFKENSMDNKMDKKKYYIGMSGKTVLICDETEYTYYTTVGNEYIMLICNEKDKSTKLLKKKDREGDNENINEELIEHGVVKQISEEGDRWEGDWYTEKPFGFGSLFDGEGNRIYSGFMFEGKKVGFGTEFFSDNHKVDYCGHFMNGLRHGWGTTYDRNNNKLFEGDWRCGKNDFEDERIVIEDNKTIH